MKMKLVNWKVYGIIINWDNKLNFDITLISMEWYQKELSNMNGKVWFYKIKRKTNWFN